MGNNIADQRIIDTVQVRGRWFDIERTVWINSDGLSFDVYDRETSQCLTVESYDTWPTGDDVEALLDNLAEGLDGIADLDDYFADDEGVLANLVEILGRGMGLAPLPPVDWRCPGCGTVFYVGQEDMVLDHVNLFCDKVDGAGNAVG